MSETDKAPASRTKGPKSGKGSVLTARITGETREALEIEAARTGRSISQVVELWLEQARRDAAYWYEQLGGQVVAPALLSAGAMAPSVQVWTGKNIERDPLTAFVTAITLKRSIDRAFYRYTSGSPLLPADPSARQAEVARLRKEATEFLAQLAELEAEEERQLARDLAHQDTEIELRERNIDSARPISGTDRTVEGET